MLGAGLYLGNQPIEMVHATYGVRRQVDAKSDHGQTEHHKRHHEMEHLQHVVVTRGGDQHAQHRKRQGEDRYAGAHDRQRGAFLGQEQLHLGKRERFHLADVDAQFHSLRQ